MKKSIVFFGSGQISLATINSLIEKFNFEAIITTPDSRLHGHVVEPAIKTWAVKNRTPVYQPTTNNELSKLVAKEKFKSQLGVVAEYGLIIPVDVINHFPFGIVNSHFSLLPSWRGADPIRAGILAGDDKSGVSIIKITPGLDAGDILAQVEYPLPPDITTPQLTQELIKLNNKLLPKTLNNYLSGQAPLQPQSNIRQEPTYAPKISKAAGQIDWAKPAEQLEREVRAYLGWPGSYTTLAGRQVIITDAHIENSQSKPNNFQPGDILTGDNNLVVQAGKGLLRIDRLKPAGKKEITGAEFTRGYLKH